MNLVRVIPFLLIDSDNGLIKTVNFKNKRYIGDPINAVKIFNEKLVDELVLLDIETTIKNKEPNFPLIKEIVSEAFMPIGYGGGVSKLEHFDKLFSIGIEKVSVNSCLFDNPNMIRQAVEKYGSQSIVASLDFKKNFLNRYSVYSRGGQKKQRFKIDEIINLLKEIGFGELVLNNIDHEGRMKGYDLDLIAKISNNLTIPTIALGGAGNIEDFENAIKSGASAVGAGSMFIYHGPHKGVLISYLNGEEFNRISKINSN